MKKSFDKVAVIFIHVIYSDRTQFNLKNIKELLKLVKLLKNYILYTFRANRENSVCKFTIKIKSWIVILELKVHISDYFYNQHFFPHQHSR